MSQEPLTASKPKRTFTGKQRAVQGAVILVLVAIAAGIILSRHDQSGYAADVTLARSGSVLMADIDVSNQGSAIGIPRCTVTFLAADGSVVGRRTFEVGTIAAGADDATHLTVSNIDSALVTSATATCI